MVEKAVVVGAGGHSRVVMSILKYHSQFEVVGIADKDASNFGENIGQSRINFTWGDLPDIYLKGVRNLFLAIGDNRLRRKFYQRAKKIGYNLPLLIHPETVIENDVVIGEGTMICLGVKIGTQVCIGNNCIINTGAIIDHESIIDNDVFIAPAVTIAGRVRVDSGAFVGIGSTVIENIHIGAGSVIGAGSTVIHKVPNRDVIAGSPARSIN